MSIIDVTNAIQGFRLAGQEQLAPQQEARIKRNFEVAKSSLLEYSVLGNDPKMQFKYQPSSLQAVRTTSRPLVPMVIALIPPDTFPGTRSREVSVNAPQNLRVVPIRQGRNIGTRAVDAEGNPLESTTAFTQVFEEGQVDNGTYLDTLKERYLALQGSKRKVDRDLFNESLSITSGRREVRDTFAQRSSAIQEARTDQDNEALLREQIEAMRNLPPLAMYVNPSSWEISYSHVLSDGNKSRTGYIIEHWGLQQPTISASGSIGAMYVHDRDGRVSGLTHLYRDDSAAYQSFMNLFQIYQNNSYIYNLDDRISVMGSVKIFYADTIYTGSFDSFSFAEKEDSPYTFEYSFNFTVRYMDRVQG